MKLYEYHSKLRGAPPGCQDPSLHLNWIDNDDPSIDKSIMPMPVTIPIAPLILAPGADIPSTIMHYALPYAPCRCLAALGIIVHLPLFRPPGWCKSSPKSSNVSLEELSYITEVLIQVACLRMRRPVWRQCSPLLRRRACHPRVGRCTRDTRCQRWCAKSVDTVSCSSHYYAAKRRWIKSSGKIGCTQ